MMRAMAVWVATGRVIEVGKANETKNEMIDDMVM
jgi:hypothetical protein